MTDGAPFAYMVIRNGKQPEVGAGRERDGKSVMASPWIANTEQALRRKYQKAARELARKMKNGRVELWECSRAKIIETLKGD